MPARLSKCSWLDLHAVLVICSVLLYLGICVVPFLMNGAQPLGYDTGFYRRYLINPLVSVPNTPVPGVDHTIIAPRVFLDVIRSLGLSPDINLYGSYVLLMLIFAGVFYYFLRVYTSKNIALFALILLTLSPIQYLAYWFMFYKNFFGLIFLFLTLVFLKKKWFVPSLICALLVPLSHQTTTIILLGVLGLYFLITLLFEKKLLISELVILFSTLLVYLSLHPHVQQKIDAPPIGIFIEKIDFILLTIPLLILTLIGLPKFINLLKQNLILIAFGGVSIIFPLFSLPYYQRIFLFTNYWLIIGAAVGAHALLEARVFSRKFFYKSVAVGVIGLFIFHSSLVVNQILKLKPLITPDTIVEINKLKQYVPDHASVLTSARLTPWVQGWTVATVYAPGILKDQHPSWEWQSFWTSTGNEKLTFLSSFPKPLYIFIDDSQSNLFLPKASCIRKLSSMLYVDECTNKSNE
ncbi:MAG: hypothetical protein EXS50_02960 [Candidatus Taylorbacteria bacterium]|nr:hypothetical protein [Candidatus Taylorbacteria bacterium]